LRSNTAAIVHSLSLRLVVSEALPLDVPYRIQIYLKVVPIYQSMYAQLPPPKVTMSWSPFVISSCAFLDGIFVVSYHV
jgi:hypothetical protein